MMDSPEFAELIADAREKSDEESDEGREWRPPLAEFGLAEDLALSLVNEVRALRRDIASFATGKDVPVKLLPGPRTLVDDLIERRSWATTADLLAMFAPHVDVTRFRN